MVDVDTECSLLLRNQPLEHQQATAQEEPDVSITEKAATGLGRHKPRAPRWLAVACLGFGLVALAATIASLRRVPTTERADVTAAVSNTEWPPVASCMQTMRGGGKLEWVRNITFVQDWSFAGPSISVDVSAIGQEILGFGGAFTEASATIFQKLSPPQQEEFLEKYFGNTGIGYTMGRVHINSCDFSVSSYSFDDMPDDFRLGSFDHSVKHDVDSGLINLLIRAKQHVEGTAVGQQLRAAGNLSFRLLATPWSPPAWMKSSGKMDSSGTPGLRVEEPYHDVWARYISSWISAYQGQGLQIWALSVQNEPSNSPSWEACVFSPVEEADFVAKFLGPCLSKEHPEVLIFVHDDSKHNMVNFAQATLGNPVTAPYVDGVAFHWYTGDLFENVAQVKRLFPQAQLLASEATYEKRRWRQGAASLLGYSEWSFGEGYAHDIIGDLNAGAAGWIDWNLLLDKNGGPNHVGNMCDAAAVGGIADNGTAVLEWHPQYFYIGQFSKFFVPGSHHVRTTVLGSAHYSGPVRDYGTCSGQDGLEATAVLRPDGKLAVVVLNCGDQEVVFQLRHVHAHRALQSSIPPHAIQTYLLDGCAAPASC